MNYPQSTKVAQIPHNRNVTNKAVAFSVMSDSGLGLFSLDTNLGLFLKKITCVLLLSNILHFYVTGPTI